MSYTFFQKKNVGGLLPPGPPGYGPAFICSATFKLWSFQRRTVTSSFVWFTRNNRYDSVNTGRSQRALSISTQ